MAKGGAAATKAVTPRSASLLFNNCAANGKHVAYSAYTTAVIVPEGLVLTGSSSASSQAIQINDPDSSQIQQIRWVQLAAGEVLVIASQRSLQLYTPDAQRLLHVVTAAETTGDVPASYRGISSFATGASEFICVGVSTGNVCVVPLLGPTSFGESLLSPASAHPIADLSAGQAPHNDPSRALVCSSDAVGDIHVHAMEEDGTWGHCTSFNVTTIDGTPPLCTSLRMRGPHLYSAYNTGHVRIWDLVTCSLTVSITAHPRFINALEVHPDGCLFATASEDTTISLWAFNESPDVRVSFVRSIPVQDNLLTGVAFCGGFDKSHVTCAAYDVAALQAWRLD